MRPRDLQQGPGAGGPLALALAAAGLLAGGLLAAALASAAAPGAPPAVGAEAGAGGSGERSAGDRREPSAAAPPALRYLALGDSYTIGESVARGGRWPVQLAALLRRQGLAVAEPEIVARTGWTTGELSAGIDAAAPHGPYALVSLLIGVNDQYRGGNTGDYRQGFTALLRRAIAFAGGVPGRVLVLSIPDWSVTPYAAASARDLPSIAHEIQLFNQVNRETARLAGVRYVDITPVSQRALGHPELLAADGLHPSAAMYAEWARLALPEAVAALGR